VESILIAADAAQSIVETSEYKRWVRRLYYLGLTPAFRVSGKKPKRRQENLLRNHPPAKSTH
jgi:hypothetical protein